MPNETVAAEWLTWTCGLCGDELETQQFSECAGDVQEQRFALHDGKIFPFHFLAAASCWDDRKHSLMLTGVRRRPDLASTYSSDDSAVFV